MLNSPSPRLLNSDAIREKVMVVSEHELYVKDCEVHTRVCSPCVEVAGRYGISSKYNGKYLNRFQNWRRQYHLKLFDTVINLLCVSACVLQLPQAKSMGATTEVPLPPPTPGLGSVVTPLTRDVGTSN